MTASRPVDLLDDLTERMSRCGDLAEEMSRTIDELDAQLLDRNAVTGERSRPGFEDPVLAQQAGFRDGLVAAERALRKRVLEGL